MKRRQKPRNKITQLDVIKSVRRLISKPTQVHHTKKEKHKWDWEEDIDDEEEFDVVEGRLIREDYPEYD